MSVLTEQMVNINKLWSSFSLTYVLHLYLHRSNAGPHNLLLKYHLPVILKKLLENVLHAALQVEKINKK